LLSIAYVSVATRPMSDADIAGLLVGSRANNERDGITGALLYNRGRFIQIVEGEDDTVRARFDAIAADPRHRNVRKMREKTVGIRQFPQWTMGYREPTDESITQLDGFEDFFTRTGRARLEHAENEAQQFLEWLSEYWLPPTRG
jgi:hypothetical protein